MSELGNSVTPWELKNLSIGQVIKLAEIAIRKGKNEAAVKMLCIALLSADMQIKALREVISRLQGDGK